MCSFHLELARLIAEPPFHSQLLSPIPPNLLLLTGGDEYSVAHTPPGDT